jgi:hypothetical protein
MIRVWHGVYRKAGGIGIGSSWNEDSGEYKGPFLDLLYHTLIQTGNEYPSLKTLLPSKDALGQMIRTAIRSR